MTTVDDRLREAAASLELPHDAIPPFQRVHQRVRRRRLIGFAAIVVALIAVASLSVTARGGSDRVFVANPGSTAPSATSTTAGVRISIGNRDVSKTDYPYDLVGNAPPIAIDHIGKYTWTSSVVLPFVPSAWNWSNHAGGTGSAAISNPSSRLVSVPGGHSLRVSFTVFSFSGAPTLQMISHANGPPSRIPPKGYVFIPNVVGMTRGQATDALNRAHLGVIVAVAGAAQPQRVVAMSPIPGTALRTNGAVTITLGRPPTGGS